MSGPDLRYYVLAVRLPEKPTKRLGTAFLIALEGHGYAVTCHHVIGKHVEVELYFEPGDHSLKAQYVPEYSRLNKDIAVLKLLEPRPDGLQILNLREEEVEGKSFESYGCPEGFKGLGAGGEIVRMVPPPDHKDIDVEGDVLQLRTTDVKEGMSGAPVVLSGSEVVVGMIIAGNKTRWNVHVDLAFAQTATEIRKACRDLIPDSPIQGRKEWLGILGFDPDPFLHTDGSRDPHLSEYFCRVPNFSDILGDENRLEPVLVFGSEGTGKSSLRNVVAQMSRAVGVFPIEYLEFDALADKAKRDQSVQIGDHVAELLRLAIDKLATEADAKRIRLQEFEGRQIVQDCLWDYVHEYGREPYVKNQLRTILEPSRATSEPLPEDYRELVRRFCLYTTQLFGFSCVYFLIDPKHDISSDVDLAWQVLQPLMSDQGLLDMSEHKVAFKFFLDQNLQSPAMHIPWIRDERGIKRYRPLVWSKDELYKLLRLRLSQCSTRTPPHSKLGELSEVENLDDLVIQCSSGKPRKLIRICDRIFSIHCQSPIDRNRILITREEVEKAFVELGLKDESELDSLTIRRLLAEGENVHVEFKSTMRWNLEAGRRDVKMDMAIARTLCAFMNTEGGALIIGADSYGQVLGLSDDFNTLSEGNRNVDGFESAFSDIVKDYLELGYRQYIREIRFVLIEGKSVCAVGVEKSPEPVYCLFDSQRHFFVRVGNSTRRLDAKDTVEYYNEHFGTSARRI